MNFREELTATADKLESLFERAKQERDGAEGSEKSFLRKVTKDIDSALSHLERAEDLMEDKA